MAFPNESVQLLKENQWNLDPLFRTFPKLFIRDILEMSPYPTARVENITESIGAFCYNNHPIINADVIGVIVKVFRREKCTIYDLDDGTGVISCLCWKQGISEPDIESIGDLSTELETKLKELSGIRTQIVDGFNLGDLLHVRGKIKVFNGVRELMCSYHALVSDPNMEALRMVELVSLYCNHYDVPLTLPQTSCKKISDTKIDSVKSFLPSYIEENRLQRLNTNDVLKIIEQELPNNEQVTEASITQTMGFLEGNGIIFKSSSSKEYIVTDQSLDLQKATLEVLRREGKKAKYLESGCPAARVLEELRTLMPYVHLQRATVNHVLLKLEEDSEVISLEPHYYQALD